MLWETMGPRAVAQDVKRHQEPGRWRH
jgi:hypothetical protein